MHTVHSDPGVALEQALRAGMLEQALLTACPALRAEDLVKAWAYAQAHATKIEARIQDE